MKRPARFVIALVTAPDLKISRRLAEVVLKSRLAACVNIVPAIESHYWWQGKLESGKECLLVIKSTSAKVKTLQQTILAAHPYDTAEFVVLPIQRGSKKYLDWISASVR